MYKSDACTSMTQHNHVIFFPDFGFATTSAPSCEWCLHAVPDLFCVGDQLYNLKRMDAKEVAPRCSCTASPLATGPSLSHLPQSPEQGAGSSEESKQTFPFQSTSDNGDLSNNITFRVRVIAKEIGLLFKKFRENKRAYPKIVQKLSTDLAEHPSAYQVRAEFYCVLPFLTCIFMDLYLFSNEKL